MRDCGSRVRLVVSKEEDENMEGASLRCPPQMLPSQNAQIFWNMFVDSPLLKK